MPFLDPFLRLFATLDAFDLAGLLMLAGFLAVGIIGALQSFTKSHR